MLYETSLKSKHVNFHYVTGKHADVGGVQRIMSCTHMQLPLSKGSPHTCTQVEMAFGAAAHELAKGNIILQSFYT